MLGHLLVVTDYSESTALQMMILILEKWKLPPNMSLSSVTVII